MRLTNHQKAQVCRFGRLFALALLAMKVPGGPLNRTEVVTLIVGAGEVAFRQWLPVAPGKDTTG